MPGKEGKECRPEFGRTEQKFEFGFGQKDEIGERKKEEKGLPQKISVRPERRLKPGREAERNTGLPCGTDGFQVSIPCGAVQQPGGGKVEDGSILEEG